ncbi:MAG TPA: alpha-amylase family glycosyl hydrolase, partial [Gemmatimonadaceae bacterium]|nr:alpha-amylase family glycosyl hydrolase [Gemmatimonadaceae bacterium]
MTPPLRATCRLQLNADFDLRAARAVVPYLERLGVSHVYASPVLESRGGSTHGYDVVDPTRLDPDLGTEEDWRDLIDELRARGMGLLLDIVPNHMATGHENPYWDDVLALGRRSRYAAWFDITWEAPQRDLRDRVMLPVLGDSLGKVIGRGEISLVRQGDRVRVKYFDHTFPLSPESMAELPLDLGALDREAIAAILARQHYRLAHWRRAAREINYRRFFDVNDRVALHMEDPEVFAQTHALPLEWRRRGWVDGFRVDHPDGLLDPLGYFQRLAEAAFPGEPAPPIYIEKILGHGERLRCEWPVAGTTGYDFLNQAEALFIDPPGWGSIEAEYRRTIRQPLEFSAIARQAKRLVLETGLSAGARRLADRLLKLAGPAHPLPRVSRRDLLRAVVEAIVALP